MTRRSYSATRSLALSALIALASFAPRAARAEGDASAKIADKAVADHLFGQGKQALERGDYTQACPLLARSFELDPATGALLALAVCHERAGKLASAAREYSEVATRSWREARRDREQAARAKAGELQPKLSTLTLIAATDGLQVKVNGERSDPAQFGKPLPIDGGDQLIEAFAAGKNDWSTRVSLGESYDAKIVQVPELTAAAAPAQAPAPAPRAAVPPVRPAHHVTPAKREAPALSASEWIGIGAMGLGAVGLGIGTYFALKDEPRASRDCKAPSCFSTEASDPGDTAALAFVAGGVLAVSGLAIYLVSGQGSNSDSEQADAGISRVAAWAAPGSAGLALDARF
jgi:hypothetical protein